MLHRITNCSNVKSKQFVIRRAEERDLLTIASVRTNCYAAASPDCQGRRRVPVDDMSYGLLYAVVVPWHCVACLQKAEGTPLYATCSAGDTATFTLVLACYERLVRSRPDVALVSGVRCRRLPRGELGTLTLTLIVSSFSDTCCGNSSKIFAVSVDGKDSVVHRITKGLPWYRRGAAYVWIVRPERMQRCGPARRRR